MLRHAKSSWDHDGLTDHERPLSKRGTKACGLIGTYLVKNGLQPDQVLSSDSVRTRATFALVASEFKDAQIAASFHSELYLADPGTILEFVRAAHRGTKTLLLLAHNPGIHALSLALVGRGNRSRLREMAMKFPTAGLAVISFDCDKWNAVRPALGQLEAFVTPRELE